MHADLCADVVIVGGGLAGISCAIGLRDAGLSVVLLEETGSLGGRARSWIDRKSGDVIDLGPHVLLSEHANMCALLELLGTDRHVVWQHEKLMRLVDGSCSTDMRMRALTPPLHLLPSLANVPRLSLREKLSSGPLLWLGMRIDEEEVLRLDELSAAELLRRYGVPPRLVTWFWASACMSLLNVPLDRCSAGALMRVYAQLVGHRRFRFGFADCGLSELYVPAAQRTILAAGGRVHLRSRVVALQYQGGRVGGVLLEDGTRIAATYCVMAVPPRALARVLPARRQALRPFCDTHSFEPSPHVSVYLWLDRKLSDEKFWARVGSGGGLNCGFCDLSNIRAGWESRASVIASNIVYSHRAEDMSDEEIVATTMRELAEAVPLAARARVLHSVVNRMPMAVPCPVPGTERKRPETRTSVSGLLLAGDWTRTHVPACMESAVRSG